MVELAGCVLPFSEHPYLPLQHAAALLMVGRLSERANGARAEEEGVPVGLYSSLKYSTKKNGVSRAAADVRGRRRGRRNKKRGVRIARQASWMPLYIVVPLRRRFSIGGVVRLPMLLLPVSSTAKNTRPKRFYLVARKDDHPATTPPRKLDAQNEKEKEAGCTVEALSRSPPPTLYTPAPLPLNAASTSIAGRSREA